jgi:hypothetical protein
MSLAAASPLVVITFSAGSSFRQAASGLAASNSCHQGEPMFQPALI